MTETFGRVSMHGVREELLQAQLDAAGLPPIVVHIPFPCTNDIYEAQDGGGDRRTQERAASRM